MLADCKLFFDGNIHIISAQRRKIVFLCVVDTIPRGTVEVTLAAEIAYIVAKFQRPCSVLNIVDHFDRPRWAHFTTGATADTFFFIKLGLPPEFLGRNRHFFGEFRRVWSFNKKDFYRFHKLTKFRFLH